MIVKTNDPIFLWMISKAITVLCVYTVYGIYLYVCVQCVCMYVCAYICTYIHVYVNVALWFSCFVWSSLIQHRERMMHWNLFNQRKLHIYVFIFIFESAIFMGYILHDFKKKKVFILEFYLTLNHETGCPIISKVGK